MGRKTGLVPYLFREIEGGAVDFRQTRSIPHYPRRNKEDDSHLHTEQCMDTDLHALCKWRTTFYNFDKHVAATGPLSENATNSRS